MPKKSELNVFKGAIIQNYYKVWGLPRWTKFEITDIKKSMGFVRVQIMTNKKIWDKPSDIFVDYSYLEDFFINTSIDAHWEEEPELDKFKPKKKKSWFKKLLNKLF